jgi:hypothetical protein
MKSKLALLRNVTMSTVMRRQIALALVMLATALTGQVEAGTLTKTADVNIQFSPDCKTPTTLKLGTLTVTMDDSMKLDAFPVGKPVANASTSLMQATFDVPAAAQTSMCWSCMKLHFIQEITQDDGPAKYNGVALPRKDHSVIDPPSGGWDYQNANGGTGDDKLPWYLNAGEEAKANTDRVKYYTSDFPGYVAGSTSFTTFLAAEATRTCNMSSCLMPGQILLLAGFDWVSTKPDGKGAGSTLSDIRTPTAADVTSFTDALSEAGFKGYTVVKDQAICCPEPASYLLLLMGVLVLVPRLRR